MLQEPEKRLCSPKYRSNDYRCNLAGLALIDRSSKELGGSHVFADDAEDIKRHPYFNHVQWDTLHRVTPPWVPRVKSTDSTKYFDSEEQILGGSLVDSGIGFNDRHRTGQVSERRVAVGGMDGQRVEDDKDIATRRPRDKLLRDPLLSDVVLESRKRNAFLGYAYRRPKLWEFLSRSKPSPASSHSRDVDGDSRMGGC